MKVMTLCVVCFIRCNAFSVSQPPNTKPPPDIQVSGPKSARDWKEMISVLATTTYNSNTNSSNNQGNYWFSNIKRNLAMKQHEQYLFQHYSRMARRMRDNKYALLIAKTKSDNKVVGMAEMGIYNNYNSTENDSTTCLLQATVGVLAVLPSYQRQGIGQALLNKCQEVCGGEGWKQDVIYAAVEPNNTKALNFFLKEGYHLWKDPDGQVRESMLVPVTVRRQDVIQTEKRPHLLLNKKIEPINPKLKES